MAKGVVEVRFTIDPAYYGLVPKHELDEAQAKIATLERDLAAERQDRMDAVREFRKSQSREASPAMLRVVEAAKAWRAKARTLAAYMPKSPIQTELIAAVDALTPAPEPRYRVGDIEATAVMDGSHVIFRCSSEFDARRAVESLNAEAAR